LVPWREDNERNGIGAVAAVPIRRSGKSVGVFLFCLEQAGSITDEIVALLERMVENVSFALDGFDRDEKKRIAELASVRSTNIFKALSATNEAILRSTSAAEMLQKVTEAAVCGGNLLGSAIFLKDQASPDLLVRAAAGPFTHFIRDMRISSDETVAEGRGFGGTAFRSGAPCICNDVATDERVAPWRDLVQQSGLRACAVVPVTAQGVTCGVMYFFFNDHYGDLDDTMVDLMSRIAANVSFGLDLFEKENARREAERRQEMLHRMYVALSATNEAIMRAKTREELLDLVCNAAVLGGRFTSTTIALAVPGEEFLEIAATRGQNAGRVRSTRFAISADRPEGRGLTGTSFRTRKPCIVNDFLSFEGTKHWHRLAQEGGTRSGASFPLLKGPDAAGVILFLASEQDVFSGDMVELLGRLAENVSFALANFDRADEKRRADQQISFLATHDPLTGLPNRLMFNDLLDLSIKQAQRHDRQFAVLFLDLDRFKIINDSLGHAAGDHLLVEVSRRLKSCVRESDVVARLGGDEFVVILNEIDDRNQIAAIARKILAALDPTIAVNGLECRTTASIGIAHFPTDGGDGETLTKNADMAMYAAKEEGKNVYRFYSHQVRPPSVERLTLETHLRNALELDQFSLHYQPKLDVASGRLTGVEALLRWRHPELGDLAPMKFIPLAEETGLIIPIGRWVLHAACEQNMDWQRAGLQPLSMAVNLSPRQFLDANLLQHIDDALASTGMPPQLLQLEITESMVMQNVERAVTLLNEIRGRGVRLAIDDFGTGYSSMSLMKRFPIDTIKIDRSFVRDLAVNPQDRAIATAIIAMGRALGLTVVAEGVETAAQDAFLRQQMCDELQGYLFSKPLPPHEFSALLASFTAAPCIPSVEAPPLAGDGNPDPDAAVGDVVPDLGRGGYI
ncbi:MAG: EAL domain-containing protein, partial [Xanthobacteraceae bacterium]